MEMTVSKLTRRELLVTVRAIGGNLRQQHGKQPVPVLGFAPNELLPSDLVALLSRYPVLPT